MKQRMTAEEWLNIPDYHGVKVLDPDGWDRSDFERSWAEQITREEFEARLTESTCLWPAKGR